MEIRRILLGFCIAFLAFVVATEAYAKIYRVQGESGNVVYTDMPGGNEVELDDAQPSISDEEAQAQLEKLKAMEAASDERVKQQLEAATSKDTAKPAEATSKERENSSTQDTTGTASESAKAIEKLNPEEQKQLKTFLEKAMPSKTESSPQPEAP